MAGNKRKTSGLLPLILGLILILTGLSVFLFPKIRFALFNRKAENEKAQFDAAMISKGDDLQRDPLLEALYERLKKENERIYANRQQEFKDPFVEEQEQVDLSEYGLEDNVIGYITIEKIGVTLPIILGGGTQENMRRGAVHMTGTSYPIGGENTNSVIAAHRGSTVGAMFRNIHLLEPGDEVVIENFREKLVYRMVNYVIMLPHEVENLLIQDNRDLITLYSCNPLGQNKQRLIVYCERVPDAE